jgi:hypothetical protein
MNNFLSKSKGVKLMGKKTNLSLSSKVDAAFKQAAKKVIERAKQTSTPVIVWEDGCIKEIPANLLNARYEAIEQSRTTR